MDKQHDNRRIYRNSMDFVESGFRACWRNSQDLVGASERLVEAGFHAPALSLAVLALEELGKLYAVDGLLYARRDDHKAEMFSKANRSHAAKLEVLFLLPLLIDNLSRMDPRYGKDESFNSTLVICIQQLKSDGNEVLKSLPEDGFQGLDAWKQQGFYARLGERGFVAPRDAIAPEFAKAVFRLAWRATTTLDFILKGGALERYIGHARSLRKSMTEEQHRELERIGAERFDQIFANAEDVAPGGD